MNLREYFLKVLGTDTYRYKEWVLTAFSVTQTPLPSTALSADGGSPYPYTLYQTPEGTFYSDPERGGELVPLKGTKPGEPPYRFKDVLELTPGDLANVRTPVKSTYGNALVNQIVLVYAFGAKVEYVTGVVSVKKLEKYVESRIESDPAPGEPHDPSKLYVSEVTRFNEALFSLVGYTQLCVPSATPKTLTTDPRIPELRKQLLEKYKDHLTDPAYIALIEKELIAMDRAWIKGDPGEGFYIKDKSYDVIRKRVHLMYGAESGFKDGPGVDLVVPSLNEGWDINKLPVMVNSLREGSFSRGAETALGGEAVKFLGRMFQNTTVTEPDCGSTVGLDKAVTLESISALVGSYQITPKGPVALSEEVLRPLVGRVIPVRTPLYCKTAGTGLCAVCVGKSNALSPTSLGLLAADVGSQMMGISMSLMHGTKLETSKYDFRLSIT